MYHEPYSVRHAEPHSAPDRLPTGGSRGMPFKLLGILAFGPRPPE